MEPVADHVFLPGDDRLRQSIDVIWDIGVGRLGQGLLTWFSWTAFSGYVRSAMDSTPVTYETFWNIFMSKEASMMSTFCIARDFATQRSLRSRTAMTFMVLCMAFILAFPTLAGAMTGYSPKTSSFVASTNGDLSPFTQFIPLLYVIHDGWRIGLSGDYPVPFSHDDNRGLDPLVGVDNSPKHYLSRDCQYSLASLDLCYLQLNVSDYVQQYGFLGLNDTESTWKNQTLSKPALNISAAYIPDSEPVWGRNWTDPRSNSQPYSNTSSAMFSGPPNTIYTVDHIKKNGSCQPGQTYQWGFSFLQLFIMLLLLLVWSVGIYIMWAKAHLSLLKKTDTSVPAKYKAALELTAAMRREFGNMDEKPESLTDNQVRKRINVQLKGGRVDSPTAFTMDTSTRKPVKGLWGWVKEERWWFSGLVTLTLLLDGAWTFAMAFWSSYIYWGVFCWTVAVYFAIAVSRTRKSRHLVSACGLVLGILVAAVDYWGLSRRRPF